MRQVGGGAPLSLRTVTLSDFGGSFTDVDGNLLSGVSQNSDGSIAMTMAGSKVIGSTSLPDPGDSGWFWGVYPIQKSQGGLWNDDTTGIIMALLDFPSGIPGAQDWITCLAMIDSSSPAAAKGILSILQRITGEHPRVKHALLTTGTTSGVGIGTFGTTIVAMQTLFSKVKQGASGQSAICDMREVTALSADGGRDVSLLSTGGLATAVGTGQMYLLFGGGRLNSGNANALALAPRIRVFLPYTY